MAFQVLAIFHSEMCILGEKKFFLEGISNTGGLVPPCAPDEMSNMRFWDALNGRAWFNNATLFGHVDFLDPGAVIDVIEVQTSFHR